jgi:competence protein ComEC
MLRFAWPSVVVSWLVQNLDTHRALAVPAPAWAVLALLLWWVAGRRAGLVVLVAAWTLVRAGWLIETRLPDALAGQDVVVRGVVCDFPKTDAEATRFVLERSGDPGVLPQRLHLSWYDDAPELAPGQRWQLEVRLKPPHGFMNPGGFDFEQWLYQRGIGASGYVRRSALNAPLRSSAADCPVGRARASLARRIERALGGKPGAGWVLGVAVGATHRITAEEWDLMRDSGTTHLLAISGLNIAMVAMPILALARFQRL